MAPALLFELENGCGSLSLRTSALVMGYIGMLSIGRSVYTTYVLVFFDEHLEKQKGGVDSKGMFYPIVIETCATYTFFLCSLLFVIGIHMQKRILMQPWLLFTGCLLIFLVFASGVYSWLLLSDKVASGLIFLLAAGIVIFVSYYLYLIAYSHYMELD